MLAGIRPSAGDIPDVMFSLSVADENLGISKLHRSKSPLLFEL
jgi:hypothetical protein